MTPSIFISDTTGNGTIEREGVNSLFRGFSWSIFDLVALMVRLDSLHGKLS
jgi:hypothetical protein